MDSKFAKNGMRKNQHGCLVFGHLVFPSLLSMKPSGTLNPSFQQKFHVSPRSERNSGKTKVWEQESSCTKGFASLCLPLVLACFVWQAEQQGHQHHSLKRWCPRPSHLNFAPQVLGRVVVICDWSQICGNTWGWTSTKEYRRNICSWGTLGAKSTSRTSRQNWSDISCKPESQGVNRRPLLSQKQKACNIQNLGRQMCLASFVKSIFIRRIVTEECAHGELSIWFHILWHE